MKISQTAYDHYWQKGWVVVEQVFEREEAEQIAQVALSISQAELDAGESSYAVDRSDDGQIAPRKIDRPFFKHPALQAFALDQRLNGLLTGLLDGKKPLLATDQIFMKPPRFGSAKPYHQDNFYFRITPADQVITAWIALDDVKANSGCLRYIEGSHIGPILPHEPVPGEPYNLVPPPDLIDLDKEVLALVGKGGVVFHHGQILHTSHRNQSENWRRGYATHWVTDEVSCETDTLDKAYYKRDDYPG